MDKIYHDREFGPIIIRHNLRAKQYSLKVSEGKITGVIPGNGTMTGLVNLINRKREKLRTLIVRHLSTVRILDENSTSIANLFPLNIFREERRSFKMHLDGDTIRIACPIEVNFASETTQLALRKLVMEALCIKGSRILPPRVEELAKQHGFSYSGLTITKTKSRWGSCNNKKQIRLSCSLMLVPERLRDYVILHELCHTEHLNHGEQFWALLNKITDQKAPLLRNELKACNTSISG